MAAILRTQPDVKAVGHHLIALVMITGAFGIEESQVMGIIQLFRAKLLRTIVTDGQ